MSILRPLGIVANGALIRVGVAIGSIYAEVTHLPDHAKTIAGIGASVLSVFTLGKNEAINSWANMASSSKGLLPRIYAHTLMVIDPKATFKTKDSDYRSFLRIVVQNVTCKQNEEGEYVLRRTRLSFLGVLTLGPVARIADFVVGVFAAIASVFVAVARVAFAAFGSDRLDGFAERVNVFAGDRLFILGAIADVCMGVRGLVNPHQNF